MAIHPLDRWFANPPAGKIGLPLLIQSCLNSALKEHELGYVDFLVDELDERGPEAWRESTLTFMSALGRRDGAPSVDAREYLARRAHVSPSHRAAVSLMTIFGGRWGFTAAEMHLRGMNDALVSGAARCLLTALLVAAGWPGQRDELHERYCSFVDELLPVDLDML